MAIAYPGGVDSFTTPSSPETTPLSEAGDGTRNHTQSIKDQGLAIVALEQNTSQKTHNHDGADDTVSGPKLLQANTHETPDTDTAVGSIHHTIDPTGASALKAAAANHAHDYMASPSKILNRPYLPCTSITRPSSPFVGLLIFETDTHRFRIWDQYPGDGSPAWKLLPLAFVPIVRLRQTTTQQIAQAGSVIQFNTQDEDNNDFWDSGANTDIVIREAGLYDLDASVAWNSSNVPDTAYIWFTVNGQDTYLRAQMSIRGNTTSPGFAQAVAVSGKLRLAANDVVRVKAGYRSPGGIVGFILSFFDGTTKIASRVEIVYLGA